MTSPGYSKVEVNRLVCLPVSCQTPPSAFQLLSLSSRAVINPRVHPKLQTLLQSEWSRAILPGLDSGSTDSGHSSGRKGDPTCRISCSALDQVNISMYRSDDPRITYPLASALSSPGRFRAWHETTHPHSPSLCFDPRSAQIRRSRPARRKVYEPRV